MRTPRSRRDFKYEDAVEALLEYVPALQDGYERERSRSHPDPPGAYIVYEDVLRPHLVHLLTDEKAEALSQLFDFVELLANSTDERLHDLVRIAVLTPLVGEPGLKKAKRCMGPTTRRFLSMVTQ
jgi:hypothetical protein